MSQKLVKLGSLKKGDRARIVQVGGGEDLIEVVDRLLEFGIIEGAWVEIIHEAPFWKDPIAIRVRGSLVALRRSEANLVEVEVDPSAAKEMSAKRTPQRVESR